MSVEAASAPVLPCLMFRPLHWFILHSSVLEGIMTEESKQSVPSQPTTLHVMEITIIGRVQGVFFRKYTQEAAQKIGLVGTVENMSDGSVFAVAVGTSSQLDAFETWCTSVGSPKSRVDRVIATRSPRSEFKRLPHIQSMATFSIRR